MRRIIGVILGFLAGGLAVALVEGLSSLVYPPPDGLDFSDPVEVRTFIFELPVGAFLFVLTAHATGAFLAGFVCTAVVRQRWLAGSVILGTLFLFAGISNLLIIPHPAWFAAADVVLYLPLSILGGVVAGRLFAPAAPVVHGEPSPVAE